MGKAHMHTGSMARRDRQLLLSVLCIAFLTLLGKAGDSIGLERTIKANTVKTQSYSFWRQGCIYYALLPGMKESQLLPLLERFTILLNEHTFFRKILGVLVNEMLIRGPLRAMSAFGTGCVKTLTKN
ncbi:hypothetical protein Z042_12450 [Chania multitudinisentens RB-25]|uniref:Uncharacterized protein n=2 Tax=Chania TaxID=1745211 RepID=W0LFY2_9GAMM|nr:hypothetical protein Z042_12450 [Chania multitudinisentens RB-25]